MDILLKETNQEVAPGVHRRLRTYKIDCDQAMIQLHEEMMTDVDIVTQIERSEVTRGEVYSMTYVITQKITQDAPELPKQIEAQIKKRKKRK